MRVFLLLDLENLVDAFVDVVCSFNLNGLLVRNFFKKYEERETRTAAARSIMAFPAIHASSWLSLISMFMMCTGLLNSPPRTNRSG